MPQVKKCNLILRDYLLWVLEADPQLSALAAELIRSTTNEVFVSAASLLEISIKKKIGKLDTIRSSTEVFQEMTYWPFSSCLSCPII
jgi:PIN domain nuclease of toxin-antitoxin system